MSHHILKSGVPEPKGLLTDAVDLAERCWYWAKNKLAGPLREEDDGNWKRWENKSRSEWSTFKTKDVVVFHATDDAESV